MSARRPTAAVHDRGPRDRLRVTLTSLAASIRHLLDRVTAPRSGHPARDARTASPDGAFSPSPRAIRAMERL